MTKEEHLLMVAVFTKQAQFVRVIVEFLKSRGIASPDDFPAFEYVVSQDLPSSAALFQQSKDAYLHLAKGLGIKTGLETP